MLLVQPYCAYLTRVDGLTWRGVDYGARFYALMLKNDPEKLKKLNSRYQSLPIGGGGAAMKVQKDEAGVLTIRRHFASWAARTVRDWGLEAPVIVPVPNSHVTPEVERFPTLTIANAIAQAFGGKARVSPVLRFQSEMEKSHLGGTRSELLMVSNMVVTGQIEGRVVLVDDMTTTGAHLKAARRVLEAAGATVQHAVVGARCGEEQVANPFTLAAEDIDEQAALDFGLEDEEIDWPDL